MSSGNGGGDLDILTLDETDSGSQVSLRAGERFQLRLESNPSTGYSWQYEATAVDQVEFVSIDFEAGDTDLVGAPGTEVIVFEAAGAGAGIVRLSYQRSSDEPPLPERVVEYIIRIDGAPWPPDRDDDPPTTSHASVPDEPDDTVIEVADLLDGTGPREAVVGGYVVWDNAGARLCGVLMESFPPQCGGQWIIVANPDALDVEWAPIDQGVRWTSDRVEIRFTFDGERLIVGDPYAIRPTAEDKELITAFLAFADDPGPNTAAALPLAEEVSIGLGPEITATYDREELADPGLWSIDREQFRAWAGPFSALDLAEEPVTISTGSHPRCAAPPEPPPDGYQGTRRISIQPQNATSCLEWWTVDFFVTDDGTISAVTLDLFAP